MPESGDRTVGWRTLIRRLARSLPFRERTIHEDADETAPFERLPCLGTEEAHEKLEPLVADITDDLPPGSALLVVIQGPAVGSRFRLNDAANAGRDPENPIRLAHPAVSRRHAAFRRGGEGFVVADVFSLNGVFVNSIRTNEEELIHGDKIQIGPFVLLYLWSPNTGPDTSQRDALPR